MPTLPSPTLLDRYGQPARPGRPRNSDRLDSTREYARGGTSSVYAGLSTTQQFYKLEGDVDDIDLRLGRDEKEKMANDDECNASLSVLALGATSRPAEVEPAKKALYLADTDAAIESEEKKADEVARFIRRNLVYLAESQRELNITAFQIIYEALKIGHSKAEIVLRKQASGVDAGKLVLDRIKSKSRFNTAFVIDAQGNTVGIAAYTGRYLDYRNPYSRVSLTGALPASSLGSGWELLPLDKFLVVTNRPPGDDSPLGYSALRPAYRLYRCKRDILPMYLKALDNTATPFIFITGPQHEYAGKAYPLKEDGTPDTDAEPVSIDAALLQAVNQGRQGGLALGPHTSDAKILYNAQSGEPFLNAFNYCNSGIRQAMLLQALATGTDKHMARAAGQVHQDILDTAIRYVRRTLTAALNRQVVKMLVHTNFDESYWHLCPSISFGDVELNDFAAWAEAFSKMMTAGLLLPSQLPHIWAVMGIPQADQKELARMLEVDARLQEQILAPESNPDGTAGQSQAEKYAQQELGKTQSRMGARHRAGRSGGVVAGQ